MSSNLKPITLYGHIMGPNPPKVAMILRELNVPFEVSPVALNEIKLPPYLAINPNGRLPSVYDPNKDLTLWESGAIIEYLISEYDHDNKLSFPAGSKEDYLCRQWSYFQASGQGPYYGQAWWFSYTAPEKIPLAIDRYINEIRRVSKVLNDWLEGRQYLVGDKCTYADVSFIPWQLSSERLTSEVYDSEKEFPHLHAWLERLKERPGVKVVLDEKSANEAAFRKGK